MVGPTNAPSLFADGRRPSTASVAPSPMPRSIHSRMRSRDAHETTGPTSVPSSRPSPTASSCGAGHELLHQRHLGVAHRDHHRAGHAALAGGAERAADDVADGLRHHGVGHHHHEVLGAAQRLHPLAVGRRPLVHVAGDGGRADERDGVDAGMVEDAVDDVDRAVDQVDDAVRQPAVLVQQVEHQLLRQRHLLGGLEDERVAAGDRERQEPERHHGREVERDDGGADADRLPEGLAVDGGGHVLEHPALHGLGDGRGRLHHLDGAADLGPRVREGLAHLAGHRPGDLVLVGLQHLAEAEQPARALDRGAAAPGREGGAGRRDGGVDVLGARQRHPRQQLAGGRVGHVELVSGARPGASRRRCSCRAVASGWRPGTSAFLPGIGSPPNAGSPAAAAATVHCVSNDRRIRTHCPDGRGSARAGAAPQRGGERGGRRPPAGEPGGVGARVRDAGGDRDAARRRVPAHDRHRAGGDDAGRGGCAGGGGGPRRRGRHRPGAQSRRRRRAHRRLPLARPAAARVRQPGAVRRHHPRA